MEKRQFRVPRFRKSTQAQLDARARYVSRHPERIKARRLAGAAKLSLYCKRRREDIRVEVLTHYGPSGVLGCSWTGCFITDIDMLVLDHTDDTGAAERKALGGKNARGWNFYLYLIQLGFPVGYQTLCCNHNHKKELIRSRLPKVLD